MKKENIRLTQPLKLFIAPPLTAHDPHLALLPFPWILADRSHADAVFSLEDFPLDTGKSFPLHPQDLADPIKGWDTQRRLLAHVWFKSLPLPSRSALQEAWYILKFLCQELDNPLARAWGTALSSQRTPLTPEELEEYRQKILRLLHEPSSAERIRGSLWKNYAHQRKKTQESLPGIHSSAEGVGLGTLLQELRILEDYALNQGIFFGTSPVIWRGKPL